MSNPMEILAEMLKACRKWGAGMLVWTLSDGAGPKAAMIVVDGREETEKVLRAVQEAQIVDD